MPKWLANPFGRVFPMAGYDIHRQTINGVKIKNLDEDSYQAALIYHNNLAVRILTWFGFDMRMRYGQKIDSSSIFKTWFLNLVGWPQKNASIPATVIKIILAVTGISLAASLISVVFSTLIHTAMLFTELLPLTLAELCREKAAEVENKHVKGLLGAIALFFDFIHFIGRSITSPVTGMFDAYTFGRKNIPGVAGKIIGVMLAAVSLTLSIAAFTVAAIFFPPLLAKAIGALTTYFPALGNFLSSIQMFVMDKIITPYVLQSSWIGPALEALSPVFLPVVKFLGLSSPLLPIEMFAGFFGLTVIAGAATGFLATVGAAISNVVYNKIGDAFAGKKEQEMHDYQVADLNQPDPNNPGPNADQLVVNAMDYAEKRQHGVIQRLPKNMAEVNPHYKTSAKLSTIFKATGDEEQAKTAKKFGSLELNDANDELLQDDMVFVYNRNQKDVDFVSRPNVFLAKDEPIFKPRVG